MHGVIINYVNGTDVTLLLMEKYSTNELKRCFRLKFCTAQAKRLGYETPRHPTERCTVIDTEPLGIRKYPKRAD